MATITFRLSRKGDKLGKREVLVRFRHGKLDQYAATGVHVAPQYWSDGGHGDVAVPCFRLLTDEKRKLQSELRASRDRLRQIASAAVAKFQEAGNDVPKGWLQGVIDEFNHPGQCLPTEEGRQCLLDVLGRFIDERDVSAARKRHYEVLRRKLMRYELYAGKRLCMDDVAAADLRGFERFLFVEHELARQTGYGKILEAVPESREPLARGKNSVLGTMRMLRAFFRWAAFAGVSVSNPFKGYKMWDYVYGTPYYLTIAERERLRKANFSRHPRIAMQRDVFVFQCLVGCRVGDLWALTKANVIDGAIEYVPRKTKGGRPVTVRVPLTKTARAILDKYRDCPGKGLFPFTSQQRYNKDIKAMLRGAGINRWVTVINPTTRETEQRRIYEVASSHMARRTFVGNLYKKVKDPNLIGKLSGHVEGSRAFARYRDIDEETKRETVGLLEAE